MALVGFKNVLGKNWAILDVLFIIVIVYITSNIEYLIVHYLIFAFRLPSPSSKHSFKVTLQKTLILNNKLNILFFKSQNTYCNIVMLNSLTDNI